MQQEPRFSSFVSDTIRFETGGDKNGGYTNDPKDAGGETKWGISKRAHPNLDIKNLTYKQAVEIYKEKYYNPYLDLIFSDNIAFKLFDIGVLMGPQTAIKLLQTVIVNHGFVIKIDGVIGPLTLTALHMMIADLGEKLTYEAYVEKIKKRLNYLTIIRPWNRRFIKGWLNRADYLFRPFVTKAEVKDAN